MVISRCYSGMAFPRFRRWYTPSPASPSLAWNRYEETYELIVGDYNLDGNLDIAATNQFTFTGVGNGTFDQQTLFDVGDGPTGLTTLDCDGDGKPDLANANFGGGGGPAAETDTIPVLSNTTPVPTPVVSISDVTQAEGNSGTTSFVFNVTLSNSTAQTVTVGYTTQDGTAMVADNDYATETGTVTFAPGDTSETVTIDVTGDTKTESDEAFTVVLSNPTNMTIADGTDTITDDAPPPPPPPPDDCTIIGAEGDDVLIGTSEDDAICGLVSNDTIKRLV